MSECLVTKLKGTVDDRSLLKLGELKVNIGSYEEERKEASLTMRLVFDSAGKTITVIGTEFTDSSFAQNNGTSVITTGTGQTLRVLEGGDSVFVSTTDKYDLTEFYLNLSSGYSAVAYNKTIIGGLEMFRYCTKLRCLYLPGLQNTGETIEPLKNLSSIEELNISYSDVVGTLAEIASYFSGLTSLNLSYNSAVTGSLSDISALPLTYINFSATSITGDLQSLSQMTGLTTVRMPDSGITGNISVFANISALTIIQASGTDITGNLSSIASLSLTELNLSYASVEGDISELGNMTALTALYIAYSAISGSVESLVQALRKAGKTSGTMILNITNSSVTYNGSVQGTSGNQTLTWTSSSMTWNDITVSA